MRKIINSSFARHVLLWLGVFWYFFVTSNIVFFRDYTHLTLSTLAIMIPQIILAYLLINWLVPTYLQNKRYYPFAVGFFVSLAILFVGYVMVRMHFFDAVYLDTYNEIARNYAQKSLVDRILDPNLFVTKAVKFITPAALLYTYQLYKDQQMMLQLREQRQVAELSALKNQLNPHFLFNTLNNLYTLALEQSTKTPEVIERLSEMLDYMLYRCKDNYVALAKEVTAIENYVALEKIRYGSRVAITFKNGVQEDVQIAPLILLTLIENAFKHGVSQELDKAEIMIEMNAFDDHLEFSIFNTKPLHAIPPSSNENTALGLENITKQLNLLYPKTHTLHIEDTDDTYTVSLKILRYEV